MMEYAVSISYIIAVSLISILKAQTPKDPLFGFHDYDDAPTKEPFTIETVVWYPLRVWHLGAIAGTAVSIIVIIVCCCCDFRVPRTGEEIEKDKQKLKIANKYAEEMNNLCFGTAGTKMLVPPMYLPDRLEGNTSRTTTRSVGRVQPSSVPLAYHPTQLVNLRRKEAATPDKPWVKLARGASRQKAALDALQKSRKH